MHLQIIVYESTPALFGGSVSPHRSGSMTAECFKVTTMSPNATKSEVQSFFLRAKE